MRPYSSVKAACWLSYTCFISARVFGSLGRLGPNSPNHAQGHTKSNLKSSAPQLASDEVLLLCQGDLGDSVISALWVLED